MSRVITIAVAEFEQAVRSRAFLIGLLALPLLMGLAFGIQVPHGAAGHLRATLRHRRSHGRCLGRRWSRRRARTTPRRPRRPEGARADGSCPNSSRADGAAADATRLSLSDRVRRGELFAFVEIPADVLDASGKAEPRLQYYTEYPTYQALPRLAAAGSESRRRRSTAGHARGRSGRDTATPRAGADGPQGTRGAHQRRRGVRSGEGGRRAGVGDAGDHDVHALRSRHELGAAAAEQRDRGEDQPHQRGAARVGQRPASDARQAARQRRR